MAYKSTDWMKISYRGESVPGIREHKKDKTKFLFIIYLKQKVRKKIIIINDNSSQIEKYKIVIRKYSDFRTEIYNGFFIDASTFEEMFLKWISIKPDTRWMRQVKGMYKNHLQKHFQDKSIRNIKSKDIDIVMTEIKAYKPRTQKGIMSIIQSVFQLSLDEKYISSSPIETRHSITVHSLQQKTVILDATNTYKRVYSSILEVFANEPVWRCLFLFGINGRRKSETLKLQWKDISFEAQTYIIRGENSKVKQDLLFTLPTDVLAALEEIKAHRPKSEMIFINPKNGKPITDVRMAITRIREHSKYREFGFHRMRNLLSSSMFDQGVSASYLSDILGHNSPETIKQYLTLQRSKSCEVIEDASKKLLSEEVNNVSA